MKLLLACLAVVFLGCPAVASAQTAAKPVTQKEAQKETLRDRAIKRCKENRGTDCDSDRGLREWLREEETITDEQRQAAAASRRHREKCAKNPKGSGC